MKYLQPRLWVLLLLMVPVGLLINHFRPLGQIEAIRAALRLAEAELPGSHFVERSAEATWLEGHDGHWEVTFESPADSVSVDVTPRGHATRIRWFPKPD